MARRDEEEEESLFVGGNSDDEMADVSTVKIKTEPDLTVISSSEEPDEPSKSRRKPSEGEEERASVPQSTVMGEPSFSPVDEPMGISADGDEIVQEFPVYFSTGLLNKLYLLQYPTRSAARPLVDANNTGILDSRMKLSSKLIEVDVPIETKKFYDTEKGEHWENLNKQTFSGIAKPSDGEYMIGVFKNNELHLNAVSAVAQLRPQFQHITHRTQADQDVEMKEAEKEKAKKQPRAVQMTAMGSGENAPNFSGAISARKRMEDEDFVGMDWYDRDSDESWNISDKLIATTKKPLVSKTTVEDYVEKISAPYVDPTLKIVQ